MILHRQSVYISFIRYMLGSMQTYVVITWYSEDSVDQSALIDKLKISIIYGLWYNFK